MDHSCPNFSSIPPRAKTNLNTTALEGQQSPIFHLDTEAAILLPLGDGRMCGGLAHRGADLAHNPADQAPNRIGLCFIGVSL